jgi:hypothetical protein
MVSKGIYSYNKYGDNLARKKRRHFFLKISGILAGLILLVSGFIYLIFFSPVFQITGTDIKGLETIKSEDIYSIVDFLKEHRILGPIELRPYSNIIFFDSDILKEKLTAQFSEIKDIQISKKLPHKLDINITERHPLGTWCNTEENSAVSSKCRYFDDEGKLWGNAIRSSGYLLINVDDNRTGNVDNIDETLLSAIRTSISDLNKSGIKIKNIEIPQEVIDDFKIFTTDGYYLNLSTETDIPKQIKSMMILLREKGEEFHPQYLDLRINDRVYYK